MKSSFGTDFDLSVNRPKERETKKILCVGSLNFYKGCARIFRDMMFHYLKMVSLLFTYGDSQ